MSGCDPARGHTPIQVHFYTNPATPLPCKYIPRVSGPVPRCEQRESLVKPLRLIQLPKAPALGENPTCFSADSDSFTIDRLTATTRLAPAFVPAEPGRWSSADCATASEAGCGSQRCSARSTNPTRASYSLSETTSTSNWNGCIAQTVPYTCPHALSIQPRDHAAVSGCRQRLEGGTHSHLAPTQKAVQGQRQLAGTARRAHQTGALSCSDVRQ